MTVTARVILAVLPVVAVMATATTLAVWKTPWRALPGAAGAFVAAGQGHVTPREPAASPDQPAVAAEPRTPTLEATAVVDLPPQEAPDEPAKPATEPVPATLSEPRGEAAPVDYARLHKDVHVVTSTLERFNQKLLRMIAQARAAQAGKRPPASVDAGPTVALDATTPAPTTSDELNP